MTASHTAAVMRATPTSCAHDIPDDGPDAARAVPAVARQQAASMASRAARSRAARSRRGGRARRRSTPPNAPPPASRPSGHGGDEARPAGRQASRRRGGGAVAPAANSSGLWRRSTAKTPTVKAASTGPTIRACEPTIAGDRRPEPVGGVLRDAVDRVQQGLDAELDAVQGGGRHQAAVGADTRGVRGAATTAARCRRRSAGRRRSRRRA